MTVRLIAALCGVTCLICASGAEASFRAIKKPEK